MILQDVFKEQESYKFNTEEKRPISVGDLKNFEKENNIKFPESIRNYWFKYGDAPIKRCSFKGEKSTDIRQICNPLKADCFKEEGYIPQSFYAIAHDSGGNYFYWNSEDNKIYIVFHEDIDNPFVFCNSVEEMFKLMEESFCSEY